jgi:hypothetical protein
MRKIWIVVIASLALALSLLPGVSVAAGGEGLAKCQKGHVCVWVEKNFKGAEGESLCTGGAHPLAGYKKSAANHCANKAVWLREDGTARVCMEPESEIGEIVPLPIDELWVGIEGSHCN